MERKKFWFVFVLLLSPNFFAMNVFADEVSFTLEDRDRLIRIEDTLKEFKDSVDKRFEQVDKRFEQVINFLWMLIAIFVALTSVTIGFAIWGQKNYDKTI